MCACVCVCVCAFTVLLKKPKTDIVCCSKYILLASLALSCFSPCGCYHSMFYWNCADLLCISSDHYGGAHGNIYENVGWKDRHTKRLIHTWKLLIEKEKKKKKERKKKNTGGFSCIIPLTLASPPLKNRKQSALNFLCFKFKRMQPLSSIAKRHDCNTGNKCIGQWNLTHSLKKKKKKTSFCLSGIG